MPTYSIVTGRRAGGSWPENFNKVMSQGDRMKPDVFRGQMVIVAGASAGIGKALALRTAG